MNNHDKDFIKKMMMASFPSVFAEVRQIDFEEFKETKMSRDYLEHHPSIETAITDEDMLLLQIDMALDAGDMELFMQLTDELKGMEVLV